MSDELRTVMAINRLFCKRRQAESRRAIANMIRRWRIAEPVDDIGDRDEQL